MEPSEEAISVRIARLNALITGKSFKTPKWMLLNREGLLDALQVLYDECSIENLQKIDKKIAHFHEKYKSTIEDLKKTRINLSDFEIGDVIGRGHFGDVHVVKEKQTGDVYAMKTIRKTESLEKTCFGVERDIMALCQSQWITSLQYAFQDSTYLFLVMEYQPGGDLLGLLHRNGGKLPESHCTFYLAELVLALEDLHQMGYVHRDIKPDNVLLDRCGHLKLADFGSAAPIDHNGMVLDVGQAVGTPDYVAPEVLQAVEGKTSYGISCDYWSLGVLAYELRVGTPPFAGKTTPVVYSKIMNHKNNLKIPTNLEIGQNYVNFMKCLLTDEKARLKANAVKTHVLFKSLNLNTLREELPPFVPKINSQDDTSNFFDILSKSKMPSIENFKKKMQFSGRNLPFVGFTFTPDLVSCNNNVELLEKIQKNCNKDDIIRNLNKDLNKLRKELLKFDDFETTKVGFERKLQEMGRKLENVESVRDKLEKDLANNIAESTALKRTLEIERKDRSDLERKALDLIKSAKQKWEQNERKKIEILNVKINEQNEKINQLTNTNTILNEQLKKAITKNDTKETVDKMEKMSRKSIVTLETRIENLTKDNSELIKKLKININKLNEDKKYLEKNLNNAKQTEINLNNKLKMSEDNYNSLQQQMTDANKTIEQLIKQVNYLETTMETNDKHELIIENYKQQLIDYKKIIEKYEIELLTIKENNEKLELNKIVTNELQQKTNELNKQLIETEMKLLEEKENNFKLQKRIEENLNNSNDNELKDLRVKYWRLEKETSNFKIDKRILERELKEIEMVNRENKEKIVNLKEEIETNRKKYEKTIFELGNMNENLSLELVRLKEVNRNLEEKMKNEKSKLEIERNVLVDLKFVVKERDEKIGYLLKEIDSFKIEKMDIEERNKCFKEETRKLQESLDELNLKYCGIVNEMENVKKEKDNMKLNWEALKEACTLLENQIVEFENINTKLYEEKSKMEEKNDNLLKQILEMKMEKQNLKKLLNEEKSQLLLLETKLKRNKEETNEKIDENKILKEELIDLKNYVNNLLEELKLNDEKLSNTELIIKTNERKVENFHVENNLLKEENSEYLTQINKLKELNYKLNQQINELNKTKKVILEKLDENERILNEKINYFNERELKNTSIIKQQTKLIDFLQLKIEESKCKKTLTDKLFGNSTKKENQSPILLNYKELECKLQKQIDLNKTLQMELANFKGNSKKSSKVNIVRHKFETKLPKTIVKCDYCCKQILMGKLYSFCVNCKIIVHQNCVDSVKNTCNGKNGKPGENSSYFQAWIKVPGKSDWDRRYGVLTDKKFEIFSHLNGDSLEIYDLNTKGKIVLEPVASEISKPIDVNDLSLVLKIEIDLNDNSCLPKQVILFMASTIEERDLWFKAFQQIFQVSTAEDLETIIKLPDNLHVNCLIDVTNTIRILGTDQGLHAICNNKLTRINGLNECHRISQIPNTNLIVMLCEEPSILIYCELTHLMNLIQCFSRENLKFEKVNIKNLNGFHLLQTSNLMFCVANSKHLIIINNEFCPLRILDTAEPCSCLLFNENNLIVGADKFFIINLETFEANEFLDYKNPNLKHLKVCEKLQSFPVGILEISKNQFLLCFNEFAIFVDDFGCLTRANFELKPKCLPLFYCFIKPFLFVVQFFGIEIFKINDTNNEFQSVFLDFTNFKCVGFNNKGLFIYLNNEVKFLQGKLFFDDCDSVSEQFSFSSSIVESLDNSL